MKMENKDFKFKTTLNCGGCVSKVQADLDTAQGISEWHVDIDNVDKILTVKSQGITEQQVIDIIENKGFIAEAIR